MKKLLSSLALFGASAFAQAATLTPGGPQSYNAAFGMNFNWAGPAAGAVGIQFDWSITQGTVTGMAFPSLTSGAGAVKTLQCDKPFPAQSGTCIIFAVANGVPNSQAIPNGPLLNVSVTPTSVASGSGPILTVTANVLAADANNVPIASSGGSLSVQFQNKCDLNLDGKVDAQDIFVAASRILAKPQTSFCNFSGTPAGTACNVFDLGVIFLAAQGKGCTIP